MSAPSAEPVVEVEPRAGISNPFAIDVRALALLRMALGAILFVDLALRFTELGVLYTDGGAYPLDGARRRLFAPVSLHLVSGAPWFQGGLMALGMLCALLLPVGYRTRLMTIASWYLLVSLHHRVYYIQDVGDQLLRLILLWCIFLPLGRRYALDARSRGAPAAAAPRGAGSVRSIASAGLLCQVALLYFFGALHKLTGTTWGGGDALEMVLDDDVWVRPLGELLGQVPWMTRALTHATVWAELLAPLLLLSPFALRACRTIVVPMLLFFAVGIGSCLLLGVIPFVISAALIPFLPTGVWSGLDRRLAARGWGGSDRGGKIESIAARPASARAARAVFGTLLPGVLFLQLFTANIDSLSFPGRVPMVIKKAEFCLGLDQAWAMYAPDPVMSSFRLEMRLDVEHGDPVHLVFGGPRKGWPDVPTFEPFEEIWDSYRGRMLLDYIVYREQAHELRPFLVWACQQWTRAHPDRPVRSAGFSKEVRIVRQRGRSPGTLWPVLSRTPLVGHVCADHD